MASVSSSVKWVDNVPYQRVVNDSVYKTPSNSASHIKDLHKQELLPCLLLLKLRETTRGDLGSSSEGNNAGSGDTEKEDRRVRLETHLNIFRHLRKQIEGCV